MGVSASMKLFSVGSMDLLVFGKRISPCPTRTFVISCSIVRGKLSGGNTVSRALRNSKVNYRLHKSHNWLLF
jgi:hypothetical protein